VNSYNNDCETSSSELETTPDLEVLESAVADSLAGILPNAPIENKPILFGMFARTKAAEASAARQRAVDDCWDIACAAGLPKLIGTTYVQRFISGAFGRGAE
jgi:hypothetical protein